LIERKETVFNVLININGIDNERIERTFHELKNSSPNKNPIMNFEKKKKKRVRTQDMVMSCFNTLLYIFLKCDFLSINCERPGYTIGKKEYGINKSAVIIRRGLS